MLKYACLEQYRLIKIRFKGITDTPIYLDLIVAAKGMKTRTLWW